MTLEQIDQEIKYHTDLINASKKRLEQLKILRETQIQLNNGQIRLEGL